MGRNDEYLIQKALEEWADYAQNLHPPLKLLYANANGQYRPGQRREPLMRRGVPDLFLAYPVTVDDETLFGLYVELKTESGVVSQAQAEWLERLNAQGYLAIVCYGFGEARRALLAYIAGELAREHQWNGERRKRKERKKRTTKTK